MLWVLFLKFYLWGFTHLCFRGQAVYFSDWWMERKDAPLGGFSPLSTPYLTLLTGCVGSLARHVILGQQPGAPQYNSIPAPSTWRWPQIPQIKGSVPQDCPCPPLRMPITGPACHLSFWLAVHQVFPQPPSGNRFICSRAAQENTLLDSQFIYKRYNSGTSRRTRYLGQGPDLAKAPSFCPRKSSRCTTLLTQECILSNTWKLSKPRPLGCYGGTID